MLTFDFLFNNILLGIGLAMDTFSVSIVNALGEPDMSKAKMIGMSSMYGGMQAAMPLIGWFCVHTIVGYFKVVEPFIPWVSLVLLAYIGGKMVYEGLFGEDDEMGVGTNLTLGVLFVQGIATAIDALSVGFTIAEYNFTMAFTAAMLICMTTFVISMIGAVIGKKIGTRLSGKASVLGGAILIFIGIKICFF